jgi:peroxiredoxin
MGGYDGTIHGSREVMMTRVQIDTRAPDFTLNDFNGRSVSLSDFTGRKNVVIVFNRGFA